MALPVKTVNYGSLLVSFGTVRFHGSLWFLMGPCGSLGSLELFRIPCGNLWFLRVPYGFLFFLMVDYV